MTLGSGLALAALLLDCEVEIFVAPARLGNALSVCGRSGVGRKSEGIGKLVLLRVLTDLLETDAITKSSRLKISFAVS